MLMSRIATVLLSAISFLPAARTSAQDVTPPGAVAAGPDYRIGPEDILDVSVWKEEGLKKELLVRPDGGITFPLIGDLQVSGMTVRELQLQLAQRLEKYIPDPVITVGVLRIASNKVYVIGRVNKPGEYVAGRYLDVLQALSMAGGLTPFAAENDIKVVRKESGRDVVHLFRYSQVKAGRNLEQNIPLKGGDVVVVP
jgi:polysaccharide biosynthesis/export protein